LRSLGWRTYISATTLQNIVAYCHSRATGHQACRPTRRSVALPAAWQPLTCVTAVRCRLLLCAAATSAVWPAAKPGCHAAFSVLPGCGWCAGVLAQLCAPQPRGQQGIRRGHGTYGPPQLQVRDGTWVHSGCTAVLAEATVGLRQVVALAGILRMYRPENRERARTRECASSRCDVGSSASSRMHFADTHWFCNVAGAALVSCRTAGACPALCHLLWTTAGPS
jgi:hypothetical protein